jgi:hypothetical protein
MWAPSPFLCGSLPTHRRRPRPVAALSTRPGLVDRRLHPQPGGEEPVDRVRRRALPGRHPRLRRHSRDARWCRRPRTQFLRARRGEPVRAAAADDPAVRRAGPAQPHAYAHHSGRAAGFDVPPGAARPGPRASRTSPGTPCATPSPMSRVSTIPRRSTRRPPGSWPSPWPTSRRSSRPKPLPESLRRSRRPAGLDRPAGAAAHRCARDPVRPFGAARSGQPRAPRGGAEPVPVSPGASSMEDASRSG